MEIILQDFNQQSYVKDIDFTYHKESLVYDNEPIKVLDPIKVLGTVTVDNDFIGVKLSIKTKLEIICSRCLEKYDKKLDIKVDEIISIDEEEGHNIVIIEDNVLDLKEVAENSIYLELPFKKLCSENCKGLCQSCGINLNKETCTCENLDIDPRLAGLKDFFKEV